MKGNEAYYNRLRANFDWYSAKYDEMIAHNDIECYIRNASCNTLLSLFGNGDSVLEVGCGTGQESIRLLGKGIRLHVIDISSGMIDVLKRKADEQNVAGLLSTSIGRASDLPSLVGGHDLFDGVFSTFGAINSEPDIEMFINGVDRVLRPGGHFVAGVWNRFCLFEILLYGATFRWRRLSGRLRGLSKKGDSRFFIDTMSYSVGDFKHLLGNRFTTLWVQGLSVIAPPPDFANKLKKLNLPLGLLLRADKRLGELALFRLLGDFSLIVARKKSQEE